MEDLRMPPPDEIGDIVRLRFEEFLKNYAIPHEGEEIAQQKFLDDYMVQISNMVRFNKSTVYVNFQHLQEADAEMADALLQEYYRFEPYLRHAVHNIVALDNQHYVYDVDRGQREFFVAFYNLPKIERIRAVRTDKIGALISICGTVTRTSEVRPELFYGTFLCRKCGTTHAGVEQQFQYTEPPVCREKNCQHVGSFQLMLNKSTFIDWQRLRVQENADEIPAGSMPRSLDIICRNECVEMAKAGDKVLLTGTVVVVPDTSGLAKAGESAVATKASSGGRGDSSYENGVSGLKKLGVREMTYKMVFVASMVQITDQRQVSATDNGGHTTGNTNILPYYHEMVAPTEDEMVQANPSGDGTGVTTHLSPEDAPPTFSEADYRMIEDMYKTPQLYTQMAESICPTVYGHMEIKRGILLMLLGGVHKKTLEGISLRGDINVCIVGDPSCAKSQFLKYVHTFVPRTVYTAGKSSSAAGLTASVVRDAETGEFCVEAGALMLADNGICCIDEFDKMDSMDQVAIHEAMEQQTISITKAGIQATLNARTSILAAANPVFGRYDRTKTLKANIAISAAIMSRFDLFFIIVDECNPKIDALIAQQIVKNHAYQGQQQAQAQAPFSRAQLQRYIAFARTIHPMFTPASRNALVECYRLLRSNDMLGKNKTAYRITVRQLESLVRLSEGLARLHLDPEVKEIYVREAYRLLQRSIIFVEAEDVELEADDDDDDDKEDAAANGEDDNEDGDVIGNDEHKNRRRHEKNNGRGGGDADQEGQHTLQEPTEEELWAAVAEAEAYHAAGHAQKIEDMDEPTRMVDRIISASAAVDAEASTTGPKAVPVRNQQQPPPSSLHTKTHISAKEFEEISQLLLLHVKQCEEAHNMREEEALPFPGIQWQALITWYITQFEPQYLPHHDATTTNNNDNNNNTESSSSDANQTQTHAEVEERTAAYLARRKILSQIIRRLVKHDGSFVVLETSSSSNSGGGEEGKKISNEEKFLKLHPSMVI